MADVSAEDLAPGQRVQTVDGDRGTVRYVGPVDKQEGTWVGIEWDDPTRGKHDGTLAGRRYFACESGAPTGGSFARAAKLRVGLPLPDALAAKYGQPGGGGGGGGGAGADAAAAAGAMSVETSSGRSVAVQLLVKQELFARAGQLATLAVASLAGAAVGSAGPPGALRALAGALRSLDLGASLLPDWAAVAALGPELPLLETLDLSACRLRWPPAWAAPPAAPPPPGLGLTSLRELVLNNSGASWAQLAALQASLPKLESLHLCRNGIATLDPRRSGAGAGAPAAADPAGGPWVEGFESLRELTLDSNAIGAWSEVERLARLPALRRLQLGGNKLGGVRYPPPGAPPPAEAGGPPPAWVPFGALQVLLLGGNAIADWASVDALDRFPCLTDSRLSGNPLTDASPALGRAEAVARVGRLTALNGAAVSLAERRDAEIRYLRRVITEHEALGGGPAAAGGANAGAAPPGTAAGGGGPALREGALPETAAAYLRLHPRYAALVATHGYLVPAAGPGGAGPGAGPRSLSDDMLSVVLTCVAAAGAAKPPVAKKLPESLTLARLKQLCEQLFKVRAGRQAIYVRRPGAPLPEELLGEELTLGHLGIPPAGAELLVDEPAESNKEKN